jgi:uncharacterized membrane protein
MKPLKLKKKPNKFKDKIKNFFKFDMDEVTKEEEPVKVFKKIPLFNLTRNILFLTLALFLIIVNVLTGFDINFLYLRQILGFLFLILVPGLLIMLCFKIRTVKFWEFLVYTIGLSIAFIMFAGLAVNWTLPALGITDKPLSLYPILICFNIFLIILGIIGWKRNKDFEPFQLTVPKLDFINNIFFIIPMIFPVLAILGAFLLNNHGSNILTMILLGFIAIYVFLLITFRKKMNNNVWPWVILLIAISILLASSLRSGYVSGSDTNNELNILNSIIKIQFWSSTIFNETFGSMLSLTILPLTFYNFLSINPNFILKFIEVFIYALTPLIIYLLFEKKTKIFSFLASFFFMSQPMFIRWFTIPIRQQIAFLFFGLMILILFTEEISSQTKKTLFLIFGVSMIVSHYSTAYIALAIFTLTYFITIFYKRHKDKKRKFNFGQKSEFYLTGILILLLLLFGFLWYNQVTSTANGLINFIDKSFSNLGNMFNEDLQAPGSSIIEQFSLPSQNMQELLQNYVQKFENNSGINNSYAPNSFSFNIKIPPGNEYSFLSKLPLALSISGLFGILTKLLFIFGFIFFLFYMKKINLSINQKCLIFSSYIITGLIAILPFISIDYDLSRTFQQALFLSAIFSIFVLYFLFFFIKRKGRIIITATFLLIYFLVFSGFYTQFIGGNSVTMNLNNAGLDYNNLFVYKSDIFSANWLFLNFNNPEIIMDSSSSGKVLLSNLYMGQTSKSLIYLNENIKEPIYLRYSNIFSDIGVQIYENTNLYYEYPIDFLNNNKNKIYNNGGSYIFN